MITKIILSAVLFVVFGFVGFYGLLLLAFGGTPARYTLPIAGIFLITFFYFLFPIWNRPFSKKLRKGFLITGAILFVTIGVQAAYDEYDDRIPVVQDEVNLTAYTPFKGTAPIAKLDKPASLKLTDNLPKIDSATALFPIVSAFVQATYPEDNYTPYKSESIVKSNRTPYAYERLIKGEADIIFAAAPSQKQIEAAKAAGVELILTPIGKEGFVFFVNAQNSVENLTIEQIQDIYSGKITNWKEIGGSSDSIRPFQRPEGSGSQTALLKLMNDKPLITAPTKDVPGGMGGIITQVAAYKNYKNAIGFTFRFYSTEMVTNKEIKLLKINGIYPDESNIRNGSYPITSEFYAITTNKVTNPNVPKLIQWILSDEGQLLIERTGYTPIR